MIKFGIIANTHGIKGHIKILSNSDFKKKRLKKGSTLFLKDKYGNNEFEVIVSSWKENNGSDILKLKDYDNINDVEKFKGYSIFVDEISNDDLNDDEYLLSDLEKCYAFDQNGTEIGKVNKIVNFGGDDLLEVIINEEKKLIPFIDNFVSDVDIKNKKVIINVIPGLI